MTTAVQLIQPPTLCASCAARLLRHLGATPERDGMLYCDQHSTLVRFQVRAGELLRWSFTAPLSPREAAEISRGDAPPELLEVVELATSHRAAH